MVVVKLPYIKSTMLSSKLSIGLGHNYYGEPAWPNDILYIFPIVIFGTFGAVIGLAYSEPLGLGLPANPFATPLEILPEWYFYPTFNLLRVLPDKFIGAISMLFIPIIVIATPFAENINRFQNPLEDH
eukprot:CAMPEP_0170581966 /NCGR_PEP_ID=MMETSP0224-20130122/7327_1 /TAXON_ID=285029 /ORGANISM="Togula jolla, Strain CCCM 725" /LENGTH=127 /DNA_ID=CAMNT_0010905149 /DNA_START=21 /DNA_END=405 /DNA_ORIENTATION=-